MSFKFTYLLKIALSFSAIFVWNQFHAQKDLLTLLPGAKKLGYHEKQGYHRLIGPVNFIYQGNTMYSDSAHFYDKKKAVRAYGNVHIVKDGVNLFCDSLYYNGITKKAKLWGHVRVRDAAYKLTTDTLEYDAGKKVASYHYGGKVEGNEHGEVLTSKHGNMYPNSKNVSFGGNVIYKDQDMTMTTDTLKYLYAKRIVQFHGPTKIVQQEKIIHCEKGWYHIETEEGHLYQHAMVENKHQTIKGDTLIYQPKKGITKGYGKVSFSDTIEKTTFFADQAIHNTLKKTTLLKGHAVVMKQMNKDSLFIHADTLFQISDSLDRSKIIKAYHHAQLFHKSVQGKCDSIVMNLDTNLIEMYIDPIVWANKGELKGTHIQAHINDSVIYQVDILGQANAILELDSGQYYNQLSGKEIFGYLKDNEFYQAKIIGNARTIFYPLEELKTDSTLTYVRKGMNRLYASELKVYIDSNEVKGVTYYEKPDGVFYPMDRIVKEEQFIPNFQLNPALRPKYWKNWINQ